MERSPTADELRQAVQELVKSGDLVAVEEIDPASGKLRMRYYHAKLAPVHTGGLGLRRLSLTALRDSFGPRATQANVR